MVHDLVGTLSIIATLRVSKYAKQLLQFVGPPTEQIAKRALLMFRFVFMTLRDIYIIVQKHYLYTPPARNHPDTINCKLRITAAIFILACFVNIHQFLHILAVIFILACFVSYAPVSIVLCKLLFIALPPYSIAGKQFTESRKYGSIKTSSE